MKSLLFSAAMITLVSPAWAQDTMTTATPEALTWKDNPALPKGGQLAILVGDPTKAGGVVVQRVKFPRELRSSATHASLCRNRHHHQRQCRFRQRRKIGQDRSPWPRLVASSQTRQNTLIPFGPETSRQSSRFSSLDRAGSTTSIRPTIRARSKKGSTRLSCWPIRSDGRPADRMADDHTTGSRTA